MREVLLLTYGARRERGMCVGGCCCLLETLVNQISLYVSVQIEVSTQGNILTYQRQALSKQGLFTSNIREWTYYYLSFITQHKLCVEWGGKDDALVR